LLPIPHGELLPRRAVEETGGGTDELEGVEMERCGGVATNLGVGGLTPMKEAGESPPIEKPEVDKGDLDRGSRDA